MKHSYQSHNTFLYYEHEIEQEVFIRTIHKTTGNNKDEKISTKIWY